MIFLREATTEDLELLYEWANDARVRANSFQTKEISYQEHTEWFGRMLKDETIKQYVLMDRDRAVGQVRIELQGEEATIGYSVSAANRGRGYGRMLLSLLEEKIQAELPQIHTFVAKVKPENHTSKKLFESEDYVMKYICYEKKIKSGGGVFYRIGNFKYAAAKEPCMNEREAV